MLFLPLEEDSLLFRVCLYYGLLVLLLELFVPLLLQRRVRIEIPRLALRGPAIPLSTREFHQRRLALQQQVAALHRALAETPRRSPQKRRQLQSTAKQRSVASPSPSPSSSPLASPTSSVKVTTSQEFSDFKRRIDRIREREEENGSRRTEVFRPPELLARPMAMSDSLATRTATRGGFSFDKAIEEERHEEKSEDTQEQEDWTQAVNTRTARRSESPTFKGRRPVRLVSKDVEQVEHSVPSEAATRLEALIGARRRRRVNTPPSNASLPPPPATATTTGEATATAATTATRPSPPPALAKPFARRFEKQSERSASQEPQPSAEHIQPPFEQQNEESSMEDDEETKTSERSEPLTDFQAFCASFASGGSAAAQQATAKRKHHEAFGSEDEQMNGGTGIAQHSVETRMNLRVVQPGQNGPAGASTPKSVEKRKHCEAFGPDDEQEIDDDVAVQKILEKRNHDYAFGTTDKQELPQEKTPRIIRRISFDDEVDTLAASPPKKVSSSDRSTGKHKHKKAFGMPNDEDEDAEWRDSLAFRPHRFG